MFESPNKNSVEQLNQLFFKIATQVSPCDYFVEAGAFEGTASQIVKNLLPTCEVHAFEANPYNHAYYKKSFENTGINYVHQAVTNYTGDITFKIQRARGNSPINPVKGNNSVLPKVKKFFTYEDVSVPCTTLDEYFKLLIGPDHKIGLWIDLEGHAYEALNSATTLLPQTVCIKVEVEQRRYWQNQRLDTDVIDFLTGLGFVPVMRDREWPQQYNILFCNQNIVDKVQQLK